ncbi:hypothetical protein PR202_ga19937 [Eleusine coracana subsp. coracana]|uniref:DNA topoisomerase (ATP-hydrolyzing) n=1 Tax=Eleusine coracana subsp. coracana TaxID=191504 RepID=A0AAV5CXR6_ELECO|nr:hypothetical protein PR202_ga19937 [Eleusine coracana subsp. coracana]
MEPQPPSSYACSVVETVGNTSREQILLHPDGYIGSVEESTRKLRVCKGIFMKERVVTYVPGLLKIFDEILVYAADNKQRDPTMDTLRVDVDVAGCRISVFNSGRGVPIEVHPEEGVYAPEVIFGHLSNRDHEVKEEKRNGYGIKLANIFSTEFVIEIADDPGQKKYKQVFSENMGKKSEPEITSHRKGVNWSWTMVTFKPDLAKFNMTNLEEDVVALMKKRVFDMAGILGDTVQVVFNGQKMLLPRGFCDYVYRHIRLAYEDSLKRCPWYCEKVNDQWEVGVSVSGGQFEQVSFVNKVATVSGGTHVDYVSNLIVAHAFYHNVSNGLEDMMWKPESGIIEGDETKLQNLP